jgi:hypothetical protein
MIERYPITGPGQRNDITNRVTLCLLNRSKLTPGDATTVLNGWLEHYAGTYRTPLEEAKLEALRCRDRILTQLHAGTLLPARALQDHWLLIDAGKALLPCFPWPQQANKPIVLFSLQGEKDISSRGVRTGLAGLSDREWPYVQALLLLVLHKVLNTEEKTFQLVNEQWLEAVGRLTGHKPDWRQLQRIRDRFVSRSKAGGRRVKASKWELLIETRKGKPGYPSQYRLGGIAEVLLGGDLTRLWDVLDDLGQIKGVSINERGANWLEWEL